MTYFYNLKVNKTFVPYNWKHLFCSHGLKLKELNYELWFHFCGFDPHSYLLTSIVWPQMKWGKKHNLFCMFICALVAKAKLTWPAQPCYHGLKWAINTIEAMFKVYQSGIFIQSEMSCIQM